MVKVQEKSKSTLVGKKSKSKSSFVESLSFARRNYLLFGIGLLAIIIGYIIMATGETYSYQSLTIAPIILLIGYLVVIPIALLYRKKDRTEKSDTAK
ncbi:MAG: DUF3098 domain-containing protein [Candidatus Marinimicrobia bacterium]|nr:DUF3098 domain-containing protein [Candidatus Neomarinimicrobiota bacterium]